jgi:hypothetical protein
MLCLSDNVNIVWKTRCGHIFACSDCFCIKYATNILKDFMKNYEDNLDDINYYTLEDDQIKILKKAHYLISCFRCCEHTSIDTTTDNRFIGLYKFIICNNINCLNSWRSIRKNNMYTDLNRTNILLNNIFNKHIDFKQQRQLYFFDSFDNYIYTKSIYYHIDDLFERLYNYTTTDELEEIYKNIIKGLLLLYGRE